ncbi:MAG: sarcosine oxidase [Candidatus Peregrinibacteria bacterium Greene0416_19]|nr:MAG: sarcosine oxidase [Candidatus Peregrinibacteria bacterium Greene0416_19]
MKKSLDTIVIGLGAMGSAAAYQLSKRGERVLGIDQFSPPHAKGSSHGDTRITRLAIGEGREYVPLALRSHEIWREIEAATHDELLTVTGGLIIGNDRAAPSHGVSNFVQRTREAAQAFGITHQMMTAKEIRKRFPPFALRDDEVGYYEEQAGFVRPEACIRAQLDLARQNGAEVRANETVLEVIPSGSNDRVTVRTDRGSYEAATAVLTVGAWIRQFVRPDLAQLFTVHREVLYWFDAPGKMEEFEPGKFPIFIWVSDRDMDLLYGFPDVDGQGVKVATEQFTTSTTPETFQEQVTDEEIATMQRHTRQYLPGLTGPCKKAAACKYTCTPDFGFVIDHLPDHPQVIVASPCSGHGFKHSTAIGEMIAELAMTGQTTIDREPFRWEKRACSRA